MAQFEYSTNGYILAVKYLKDIGKWDTANKMWSTDGWSIVMFANDIWDKNNIPNKEDNKNAKV